MRDISVRFAMIASPNGCAHEGRPLNVSSHISLHNQTSFQDKMVRRAMFTSSDYTISRYSMLSPTSFPIDHFKSIGDEHMVPSPTSHVPDTPHRLLTDGQLQHLMQPLWYTFHLC
jgi:hypothetical protein